jgi:hypothetical protein
MRKVERTAAVEVDLSHLPLRMRRYLEADDERRGGGGGDFAGVFPSCLINLSIFLPFCLFIL